MYRDKQFGIPAQVLFEFTDGKLDDISYVADSPPQNPELAFLTWCLELTKRYGQGVVYLNKSEVSASVHDLTWRFLIASAEGARGPAAMAQETTDIRMI